MRLAPLFEARILAQVASTPHPSGVTAPIPVTTTRRSSINRAVPGSEGAGWPGSADGLGEVAYRIAEGLDRLGCVIGDFDREFFFERHHQLDLVERVSAQIVNEARLVDDLLRNDVQMLDDDFADAVSDIAHVLTSLIAVWFGSFQSRPTVFVQSGTTLGGLH